MMHPGSITSDISLELPLKPQVKYVPANLILSIFLI